MSSPARLDLLEKMSSPALVAYLERAVMSGTSVAVCGYAGSGKSTVLASLASMTDGKGLTLTAREEPLMVTTHERELGDEVRDVVSAATQDLLVVDDLVTDEAWKALGASPARQVLASFAACGSVPAALERLGPAGRDRFGLMVFLDTHHHPHVAEVSVPLADESLWAPVPDALAALDGPFLVARPVLEGQELVRRHARVRAREDLHMEPYVLTRAPALVALVPASSLPWLPDWRVAPDPGLTSSEVQTLAADLARHPDDAAHMVPLLDQVHDVALRTRLSGPHLETARALLPSWSGTLSDLVDSAREL